MSQENQNQEFTNVKSNRVSSNPKELFKKVANGELQPNEAEKMLNVRRPPRFVVTKSGAIALFNLQRNPIVLYPDQWDRLQSLVKRGILDTFMERNKDSIKRRPPRVRPTEQTNGQEQEQEQEEVQE